MGNQFIVINRRKYAVGLIWQPVANGYVPRGYARVLSRSINKKLNLFVECHSMIGLGGNFLGHRYRMGSIAAEVMDALNEFSSFLAVFQVDKQYLLVAVRNSIILEDKIFDNEEQAREAYFKLSEIPDWGALFAPSAWGMPRTVERNLADLIGKNNHYILKPISRVRTNLASSLLVALFILGFVYLFKEPISQMLSPQPQIAKINPELAAEYKRQIEEKSKQLDQEFQIEKKLPEPLVFPYDTLPDPIQRAEVCYQAIGFLMQPVTGWSQLTVDCTDTHAIAEFNRTFGTLGDFYNMASEILPASFVQEKSENTLLVQATLPKLKTSASLEEKDPETIIREITTLFQGIGTPVDMQTVVDTVTNGVETVSFNVVELEAESKLVPMQFMKIFEDFSGVYMSRCEWNANLRTWNYEVIIYAK